MPRTSAIFQQLTSLTTEKRNPRSRRIDTLGVPGVLKVINAEDRKVARAVQREIPYISRAVGLVVSSFRAGGRLIYAGAGTSGRLGILDATECPPTFGTSPSMVQGVIAGGRKSVFRSQEGSEDSESAGARDIASKKVGPADVVCGIAASMRTPYVIGALREAKKRRAKTIFLTTNPRATLRTKQFASLRKSIDVAICPEVGPEVVMGSTRMKSGTAQKLVLNMLTTASMIQLGKVYENMMVDLQMTSKKLEERAKKVIMIATGATYSHAAKVLRMADYHVKSAIVMIEAGVPAARARRYLKEGNGFVRSALALARRRDVRS